MTLTKNKYYFEALDHFPYNMSDCLDALNYALSYEPEDADSLCLMGRIHSEVLKDYETAKKYFEEAMQSNIGNVNTPKYYIECLLSNEDYEEAERLINYALKMKGIDKAEILLGKSLLFERKGDYDTALEQIREARKFSYCRNMMDILEDREKLIHDKMHESKKEEVAE
ncbi:tetratricopeptide repeat protein [Chryseobacterium gallinarum]|uniref:tetratricopeptide repeat protein n=1 Tax=Chryseobacterium gallinarum TaxID=1324352 RepID=UPI002024B295|nr:tetratricopeptide repeat protein [Chryseobacterium gallinarum]MCL8535951.1 tetratricopeptide repeat protein [Chryseobacterium gallinarum]